MILRRTVEHLKNQHWTGVLIELVIVVLGVFLGLQAQDWNQARQDRGLEKQYLSRMELDFSALLKREKKSVAWNEARIRSAKIVLDALTSGQLAPKDKHEFERGLYLLGVVNRPRLAWGVVEELRSTGRISLIHDVALREALSSTDNEFHWRLKLLEVEDPIAFAYRTALNARIRIINNGDLDGHFVLKYDFKQLSQDQVLLNKLYFLAQYQQLATNLLNDELRDIHKLRDQVAAARQALQ